MGSEISMGRSDRKKHLSSQNCLGLISTSWSPTLWHRRFFWSTKCHTALPLPCFVYLPVLLQNWCKRSGNEGGRMQFQAITDLTIHERNKISCLDCEALWLDMNLQWHLWEQHTRLCQALRGKKLDSWCLSRLSHFLSLRLQWEIGGYHKSWA